MAASDEDVAGSEAAAVTSDEEDTGTGWKTESSNEQDSPESAKPKRGIPKFAASAGSEAFVEVHADVPPKDRAVWQVARAKPPAGGGLSKKGNKFVLRMAVCMVCGQNSKDCCERVVRSAHIS